MTRAILACMAGLVALLPTGPSAAGVVSRDLQAIVDRAARGAVVHVPAGTYRGGVVISKPVSLVADGEVVVDGGGQGTVLAIKAADVRLEGFVVRGSGLRHDVEDAGITVDAKRARILGNRLDDVLFGIVLRGADDSVVADNVIGAKRLSQGLKGDPLKLWGSDRARVERNHVDNGRDVVMWYSKDLVVLDNVIRRGRYGLHLMYADRVHVEGNWLEHNSTGAYVMYGTGTVLRDNVIVENRGPSGYGLGIKDATGTVVEGNRIVSNRVGAWIDSTPGVSDEPQPVRRNVLAYNDVGIEVLPSVRGYAFSENAFLDNREQVAIQGGGELEGNAWSVGGLGNRWSDYAGYDAGGDGVGDVPYKADSLFSNLTDEYPDLTLFADTPGSRAIDLAARAFPALRPDPAVVDHHPLVAMPSIPRMRHAAPRPSSRGLLGASMLLLVLAGLIVIGPGRWRPFPRRPVLAVVRS